MHLSRHPTSYPTRWQEIAAKLEVELRTHYRCGDYLPAEQQLAEGIRAYLADHARFRAEARQSGEKIRRSAAGVRGHDGISVRVRFLAGKIDQKLAESCYIILSVFH